MQQWCFFSQCSLVNFDDQWAKIFIGLVFYAHVGIHQVRILVFDNYQRCPVPLSAWMSTGNVRYTSIVDIDRDLHPSKQVGVELWPSPSAHLQPWCQEITWPHVLFPSGLGLNSSTKTTFYPNISNILSAHGTNKYIFSWPFIIRLLPAQVPWINFAR